MSKVSPLDDSLLVQGVRRLSSSGRVAIWQASTKMLDCYLSLGSELSDDEKFARLKAESSYRAPRVRRYNTATMLSKNHLVHQKHNGGSKGTTARCATSTTKTQVRRSKSGAR